MSDDLVLNVRQIQEYPLKAGAAAGDAVLMQTGGLGRPYVYTTAAGLVTEAMAEDGPLGVGFHAPFDAAPAQIFTDEFISPIGGGVSWNVYNSLSGVRYMAGGPAAMLWMNGLGTIALDTIKPGPGGALIGPSITAMQVSPAGHMTLADTLSVARDPTAPLEVVTKRYVDARGTVVSPTAP